ncbi:MAG: ROK family protein, partial [Verrucomicrobiota bacterium]
PAPRRPAPENGPFRKLDLAGLAEVGLPVVPIAPLVGATNGKAAAPFPQLETRALPQPVVGPSEPSAVALLGAPAVQRAVETPVLVFDRVGLMNRVMQDTGLARLVVAEFLREVPGQIGQLKSAVAAGETSLMQRQAHNIKGACAAVSGEALRALAAALVSFGNVLDPEVVILGGGIARADKALFRPLHELLATREWRPGGQGMRLVAALLGEHAGAYGAAWNAASRPTDAR